MLSIVIPIKNEQENLDSTILSIINNLNNIDYEVLLINDFSTDDSLNKAQEISKKYSNIFVFNNNKKGLGGAINLAIQKSQGKFICILMADLSDDLNDLKTYYNLIVKENLDAVFGSRFIKNSTVIDYPIKKLILNRIFNYFVKIIFFSDYNDFTNAFKIYKKDTLNKTLPLVSETFNIFLEIPLKIISRKLKYKIIPINWKNRKKGKAKFSMQELRSKYLFTMLYCLIEKILLKNDK